MSKTLQTPSAGPDADAHERRLRSLLAAVEAPALRERVFDRVTDSVRRHADLRTVRERHAPWREVSPGVRLRALSEGAEARALRPGQPLGAWIVELAPGAEWTPALATAQQRECLVMRGELLLDAPDIGTQALRALDFHGAPPGCPPRRLRSPGGARVYLRFAPRPGAADATVGPAAAGTVAATARDAESAWHEYAPGIRRRTLWTDGVEAAYLVRAEPGAQVPAHGHRIDEECLMLDGDLYLGDILLRAGDWQLAPVGVSHGLHVADSALTLWVRGDVELRFEDA